MIIRLCLKDPDGVMNSVVEAARQSFAGLPLTDEEREEAIDLRVDAAMSALEPWVKWGEYVTVEIDTTTKEAKVLKAS